MEAVATAVEGGSSVVATRVLLASSRASGGMARHVIALMSALRGEGYKVAVACDPEGMIAEAARERDLTVFPVTFSSSANPTRAMLAAWQLSGAISSFQAHIVHTHSYHAGLVGAVSTPLARPARMIATMHSYPPYSNEGQSLGSSGRVAVRLILGRASRVIMVSEALRSALLPLRPESAAKTLVIPNGIDVVHAEPSITPEQARQKYSLPPEVPLIGLVARLAPQKGPLEFVRAVRVLADGNPDLHAVIVGDGPLRAEGEALTRELNLEDRLHWLGQVESGREVMWALDALVVSSITEGSSIVAMEAMALGKPVVATDVGGVPEVVADGETGYLVPPADAEAMAEAVARLLSDPQGAVAMGDRGRQRAALNFDLDLMISRTKAVYADLMREFAEGSKARK